MKDFVAIDFETANGCRASVCSVGIVVVIDGEIVDSFYSLIHPTPDYYSYQNIAVHGLTDKDTATAPTFPTVWQQITQRIATHATTLKLRRSPTAGVLPLVAHNKAFDESCLRAVFAEYNMEYPEYEFLCTLKASRRRLRGTIPNHRLHTVAAACGFDLTNHHHALADAQACAAIALKLL